MIERLILFLGFLGLLVVALLPRKRFHPESRPRPEWSLRRVEAFAILAVGLFYLLYISGDYDLFSRIEDPGPEGVAVYLFILLGALCGIVLAHFLALFGRTRAAFTLILILIFIGTPASQLILERIRTSRSIRGALSVKPVQDFVVDPAIEGVELWVNGVWLGVTPIGITRKELREKVPHWPEPPKDFDHELARFNSDELDVRGDEFRELIARRTPWFEFLLNEDDGYFHRARAAKERKDLYYARLKLIDEWAVGRGYATTRTFGTPSYGPVYRTKFSVEFPEYDADLNRLIGQGRLLGSNLDTGWFQAMESHGPHGEQVFWEAMEKDPALRTVADAWAEWRYGFHNGLDSETAWNVLETVCDEAERAGDYQSRSIAGHAVELAASHLDPDHLAEQTVDCLRRDRSRFLQCRLNEEKTRINFLTGSFSSRPAPHTVYPLLDAALIVDGILDSVGDSQANPIERRIPAELMCWWQSRDGVPRQLDLALAYVGPAVERYLLRQDFRKEEGRARWVLARNVGGPGPRNVNPYFLHLINLDTAAADRFRLEHEGDVLDAAETILRNAPSTDPSVSRVPFLFHDLKRGRNSLAMEFWPRFQSTVMYAGGPRDIEEHRLLFEYLVRMEPVSTVEMYVECWREYATYDDAPEALKKLRELPPPRRRSVLQAILQETRSNLSYYAQRAAHDHSRPEDYIEGTWVIWIGDLLAETVEGAKERERVERYIDEGDLANLATRLKEEPDAALVEVAARHENREVRLATKQVLITHPSKKNQELLAELLNDPDERVRAMAEEVKRSHEQLAATSPSAFAHPLAGGEDYERSQ